MPLTDPGTRSPGRLVVEYQSNGLEHKSGAWIIAGLDLDTSLDALRDSATGMATAIMDCCPNTSFAHTWYILNPDGVALFSENFPEVIVGTRTPGTPSFASQSTQVTVTGKGTPPTITEALGVTRTSVFTGYFDPAFELNKDFLVVADGVAWDLLEFLRESDIVGADKLGQKATYSSRALVQINAHVQREYGL